MLWDGIQSRNTKIEADVFNHSDPAVRSQATDALGTT